MKHWNICKKEEGYLHLSTNLLVSRHGEECLAAAAHHVCTKVARLKLVAQSKVYAEE